MPITIQQCMCRAVTSTWEDYPAVHDGIMHAPVGCIRKVLNPEQLRWLYEDLTGRHIESNSYSALYQAVIAELKDRPNFRVSFSHVLYPQPAFPPLPRLEKPRQNVVTEGGSTPVTPASKPQPAREKKIIPGWNPATGAYKPPWVK